MHVFSFRNLLTASVECPLSKLVVTTMSIIYRYNKSLLLNNCYHLRFFYVFNIWLFMLWIFNITSGIMATSLRRHIHVDEWILGKKSKRLGRWSILMCLSLCDIYIYYSNLYKDQRQYSFCFFLFTISAKQSIFLSFVVCVWHHVKKIISFRQEIF